MGEREGVLSFYFCDMEKLNLDYRNPKLVVDSSNLEEGVIKWRSPSNIAIIKYWGKFGIQYPQNPSVSFTLENAYTETSFEYSAKKNIEKAVELDFYFNGEINVPFGEKVIKYFEKLLPFFPFLKQLKMTIRSSNSFPHSAGIASSASAMSALALCLCSFEDRLFGTLSDIDEFRRKASYLARLGSGSACRSIYEHAAIWGESGEVAGATNEYAIPFSESLHPVFKTFHDDILIISKGEKSVSSTIGHGMMDGNIYANSRYQQARQRFHDVLIALRQGDMESFGRIAEGEALTLHALMMTSYPPYILMKPNTLLVIQKIQEYRKRTGQPLYFSLDAGPNLHLLYPDEIVGDVQRFIESELQQYCEDGQWIKDKVGGGPLEV